MPASAQKVQEAQRAGNVPRSADVTSSALMLASLASAALLAGPLLAAMVAVMRTMLDGTSQPLAPVSELWAAAGRCSLPAAGLAAAIAGVSAAAVIAAAAVQGGLRLNLAKAWPDLGRVSLAAGLGRLLSRRAMVRMALAVAKLAAVGAVGFLAVRDALPAIVTLGAGPAADLAPRAGAVVLGVGFKIALALAALAAADYVYQWWEHRQELMMTRREAMEELRQTQGDGRLRNRRRQMAQGFTALGAVVQTPRATLVVTGREGPAVAVKARKVAQPPMAVSSSGSTPEGGRATGGRATGGRATGARPARPRVIAQGEGLLAQRIVQAARRSGVPVTVDDALARELFEAAAGGAGVSVAANERLMKMVEDAEASEVVGCGL